MISNELNKTLRSDPDRLCLIMQRIQSDASESDVAAGINDLMNWMMVEINLPRPNTWPIQFKVMDGDLEIPEKIDWVASSNGYRIRIKPWARTRKWDMTTNGRTPVSGVNHHAMVILHEVGHLLHHTDARQVYFRQLWDAVLRNRHIPSPREFAQLNEFFADHMARQIAETAIDIGYVDSRDLVDDVK